MNTDEGLHAGFAKQVITPDYTVCLTGYGDDEIRRSQGVVDDIYLTCIAITDGTETVLMYTADLLSLDSPVTDQLRCLVTTATGIPGDHIFCSATHNHSAPLPYGEQEDAVRFRNELLLASVSVAQAALADRVPARMLSTTQEVPGMNFIRHYETRGGSYSGSNFGDWSAPLTGRHAAPTDPRMVLIQFAREGNQDIVLMNWQAHNDNVREVGYYLVSSSYVGRLREKFERDTGLHFAFFMGASGDQSFNSRYLAENHGLDWIAYGERMADYAIQALPSLSPVTGCGIRTRQTLFEYTVNHSWEPMLEQAKEVFHVWKTVGKKEADALGKTYGFSSSYHAWYICRRAALPATGRLELNAFRIGDLGFVTSTNEVFSTVGIHVRANSPFSTTFILTGNRFYLPSAAAYDYRSYEADTSVLAKGTAERVAEKLVDLLHQIV